MLGRRIIWPMLPLDNTHFVSTMLPRDGLHLLVARLPTRNQCYELVRPNPYTTNMWFLDKSLCANRGKICKSSIVIDLHSSPWQRTSFQWRRSIAQDSYARLSVTQQKQSARLENYPAAAATRQHSLRFCHASRDGLHLLVAQLPTRNERMGWFAPALTPPTRDSLTNHYMSIREKCVNLA